ncbi:unnamed protein product [Euphydryas editha]|uniref:RNase H type-1 domain-containing protein n=1 Tax=Euphydryas editha TaxID=104508 RepID=A0AAU9TKB0_EUPED|nr:unnamed protein product [Euphydryas editha]
MSARIKALAFYAQFSRAAKASWGLYPEVIHAIYRAVVELMILYAAAVWSPAVDNLSHCCLLGILPLDLHVREAAALYGARRGVPQDVIGDREVERMSSALRSPHPAQHIDLDFQCLVDQDQLIANNDYEINIFTDGSKIEGKVGAALSIWSGAAKTQALKLILLSFSTVYHANFLAICRAARTAADNSARLIGIYSDYLSALQTIINPVALHPLVVEARGHLRRALIQDKLVNLFWIKAHVGLDGNERADHLSKEAALKSKRIFDYDRCPVSFIKRSIRMRSFGEWNQRYQAGKMAGVTRVFLPDAIAAYRIIGKKNVDRFATQVLTGHGGFSEYLHRFKCKESPSCICDPGCFESVLHVLLDCPAHGYERKRIEWLLDVKLDLHTLPGIVSSKNRDVFLNYCKELCKLVNIRKSVKLCWIIICLINIVT